jgi:hypothetical protein
VIRSYLSIALKVVVIIASYSYVIIKLTKGLDWKYLSDVSLNLGQISFLLFASLLSIGNWTVEAIKWKIAVDHIAHQTFSRSLKTILFGLGVGLFTPNRIGDPIGRVAMLSPDHRAKGGVMAVICSMSQLLATLIYGLLGLALWHNFYSSNPLQINQNFMVAVVSILLGLTSIFLLRFESVFKILLKLKPIKTLIKGEPGSLSISKQKTLGIVAISFFRYLIFSTQFVLLLKFFGYDSSIINAYTAVFVTYLITSLIPTFALAEVGIRAGIAITIIGAFWPNAIGITAASIILWIINVAIPGLIGVWFPIWGVKMISKTDS